MKKISILVPCYNEEQSLPLLYPELKKLMDGDPAHEWEILFVNDGSLDGTLGLLRQYRSQDERINYVSLTRNFGKEAAIYAGLDNAIGDFVAILDADLQDPPALLPEMYAAVTQEGYDSAATRRVTRKGEPPIRSLFANIFYLIMRVIAKVNMVPGARDFRMMKRIVVNAIIEVGEYNRFSKGIFGWVG